MKWIRWAALAALLWLSTAATPAFASVCAALPYTLINGQTADANQVMANFNDLLSCLNGNVATNGANSNISSLSGLSTPLSPSQGGTGQGSSIFGTSNTWTALNVFSGGATLSGSNTLSGPTSITGLLTATGTTANLAALLTNAAEPVTLVASAANGTIPLYATSQSVLYWTTAAAANWTMNLTGASGVTLASLMSTGQAITLVFMAQQGSTAYYNNVLQVDGATTGVTTYWQGGTAPTGGNASGVDVYSYTVIKTGSATWTVLASLTQF